MISIDKLAAFDLDGTLWAVNSHNEIMNIYYKTRFWGAFIHKLIHKFFPVLVDRIRDYLFAKIPIDFFSEINFPFNDDILCIVNEKRNLGYKIIIISNAPLIIVKDAAHRLQCSFIRAPIGKKLSYLDSNYIYKKLFVCTDNKTDIDLISAADDYVIKKTKTNYKFFLRRGVKNFL